ncbi:phosphatase-like protein PTPLA [Aspergillus sp. HF37]|nr:phosphatase-like protein PTPLA [Aspergillus sp. HF37]
MPATISPLTRLYLVLYNALSFGLWATCALRTASLILALGPDGLSGVFAHVYSPLLTTTQTLAVLEVVHSLVGIVRAPLATTAMQVASRLLLVWGVMDPFGGRIVGAREAQMGDYAFLGCLFAWGVTECIRYGFFVLQVSGFKVPGWWMWLRYNTFYVLYPVGIASECTLVFRALEPAAQLSPLYWWFFAVVLAVYVPGSYILYTHMIAQRRKVMKKAKAN